MQVIIYVLIGSLFGGVDAFLFKEKSKVRVLATVIWYTFYVNIMSLAVLRFILKKPFVMDSTQYVSWFSIKYIGFAFAIGSLGLLAKLVIKRQLTFSSPERKLSVLQKVFVGLGIVLFMIGAFLWIGTVWFIDFFGKLTPEQFIFNFNSPVTGTASGVMQEAINGPVLFYACLTALFIFFMTVRFTLNRHDKRIISDKLVKLLCLVAALGMFFYGAYYSMKELQLPKVYQAYFDDSTYIKDNYVIPEKVEMTFPTKKRNLIHIYLESYENSFYDQAAGGYMEQNLMPDMEKLSREGVHFSETDKMGGPYQTYGSSWSVASMVNMSMGLPLKIPMGGNSYGKSGYFLPGAVSIGDILAQEGYNQTIMFGADADFGGLTSFFTNHKDFNIFDVKFAREEGLIPKDYNVWWGFEDKKLYAFAKDELTRLANEGRPFNFTVENADTHFPDGYIEKETPTPFDSQYANVIAHSQKEMVNFINWIKDQPFYENTTIVLTGDHLSMDKNFFKEFDPAYHRTTTNLILNDAFKNKEIKTTFREFAPFDMYPTILSSMGVAIKGDRLGLGMDLSSNKKTLIERDGLEKVNEELAKNSKYYNHEFVSERKKK